MATFERNRDAARIDSICFFERTTEIALFREGIRRSVDPELNGAVADNVH